MDQDTKRKLYAESDEFAEYIEAERRLLLHKARLDSLIGQIEPVAATCKGRTICGLSLDGYQKALDTLKTLRGGIDRMESGVRVGLTFWIDRVVRDIESNH